MCIKDAEALEAIETLHKQIDDDQSGNIDQSESDEVSIDQSDIDNVSIDQSESNGVHVSIHQSEMMDF